MKCRTAVNSRGEGPSRPSGLRPPSALVPSGRADGAVALDPCDELVVQHDAVARLAADVADRERVVGSLASRYMASRLMCSIAHASSAPNIALVDAMSLTWLLLVLLVMVVLELLSSRGSLACPAAGGSRGGRRRHFLPLLDSM